MAEQVVWTTPDGATAIDLTDEASGFVVLGDGTSGLRSVAYQMTTQSYAGIDGETVQAIRAVGSNPTLGVLLQATDVVDYRTKARSLVRAMRPKAGVGSLTVTNEQGEVRSLGCYCVGGLEGDEGSDVSLPGRWWKLALKFYAPDPWWVGEEQTLSVGLGAPTTFFPIFPMVLSPSTIQGGFAVDLSDSDDGAFPVWTITGPGSSLVLSNGTSNRSLTINTTLSSTDTLIVDTRPGLQSVRLGDGTNRLGSVAGYPDLWPLEPTVNNVTAALTGATSTSRITAVYTPRFAGI